MIVLDPGSIGAVLRAPPEVQKERAAEAAAANDAALAAQRAKNDSKTRVKVGGSGWRGGAELPDCSPAPRPPSTSQGKNKPTRRQRKKQLNVIEERKPVIKQRMREEGVSAEHGGKQAAARAAQRQEKLEAVPRALHRFLK